MGKVLHMKRQSGATDNYFRVGRREFFFSSRDLVSCHRAWDAAAASAMATGAKKSIAVYRPFALQGPWTEVAEVIGFMPAGARPSEDVLDPSIVETWVERADLRKALWQTGAWHVDGQGYPIGG